MVKKIGDRQCNVKSKNYKGKVQKLHAWKNREEMKSENSTEQCLKW